MCARETYREICDAEGSIPLFSQAWWLDAVAGPAWDAVIAYEKGKIVGTLPFIARRRWGFTILTQPKLTQSLGPWVKPTNKSYPKALAHEKDVLGALAEGLPRYHYYAQNWHCDRQNWLPFYWRGFEQTTRYTYRLHGIGNEQALWEKLQQNIRGDIRKARERYQIAVRTTCDVDELLELNRMTFERQGRSLPYSRDLVARIDDAAAVRAARDCLIAVDPEEKSHAGAYIVRHGNTAYYLMGGGDPELRSSGATSLVLWEAIRNQPEEVEVFDFEGSMIEPIERYFRAFGAQQVPYFRVSRTSSPLLKTATCLKKIAKGGA
ncbi:methicillin resistance protein [Halorhodospira neutriphila]|uniref:Methicillin resistance protein n=1 Tax=Halorhodospira neutriphila TaxID=168379 RepID=A0ABS1E3T2_9GAMM|nr:methicillin resistance protein [Halorhodospira neutriphila]